MRLYIYVEGGGSSDSLRTIFRKALARFSAGMLNNHPKPRFVACGSRTDAFRNFKTSLHQLRTGDACMLLVDSEDIVAPDTGPWDHVGNRQGDQWQKPDAATDDHLHFMAVCMESWIIADVDALAKRFGNGFARNALPKRVNLEQVPKDKVFEALNLATKSSRTGEYRKGKLSFELLGAANPNVVASKMPYCKRFFDRLTKGANG